jgi:hypothetical protein
VSEMYRAAMGNAPYELIGVHDARSLAEAYNRATAACHGEIVVYSHDDVEVLSPDLPQRLHAHLGRFDLIGVIGTSRLIGPRWLTAGPPYIFGQICHVQAGGELLVDIYGVPRRVIPNIQALDGVFMAARRPVLSRMGFDAVTYDGFHLYDIDFSHLAFHAGLRVGVVNDINLLHQSGGEFGAVWAEYARRFSAKWQNYLPQVLPPGFQLAGVLVESRAHAAEVMNPPYWQEVP